MIAVRVELLLSVVAIGGLLVVGCGTQTNDVEGAVAPAAGLEALIAQLESRRAATRAQAIVGLREHVEEAELIVPMLGGLLGDRAFSDPLVRKMTCGQLAAETLGILGIESIDVLCSGLASQDGFTRETSIIGIRILCQLQANERLNDLSMVRESIIRCLPDDSMAESVRFQIQMCRAVKAIGDETSAGILVPLLDHSDFRVRREARSSLSTLVGKDLGEHQSAWIEWMENYGAQ